MLIDTAGWVVMNRDQPGGDSDEQAQLGTGTTAIHGGCLFPHHYGGEASLLRMVPQQTP